MTEIAALLDDINSAADPVFKDAGLEVIRFPKSIPPADLVDMAHEVDVLGVR